MTTFAIPDYECGWLNDGTDLKTQGMLVVALVNRWVRAEVGPPDENGLGTVRFAVPPWVLS